MAHVCLRHLSSRLIATPVLNNVRASRSLQSKYSTYLTSPNVNWNNHRKFTSDSRSSNGETDDWSKKFQRVGQGLGSASVFITAVATVYALHFTDKRNEVVDKKEDELQKHLTAFEAARKIGLTDVMNLRERTLIQ